MDFTKTSNVCGPLKWSDNSPLNKGEELFPYPYRVQGCLECYIHSIISYEGLFPVKCVCVFSEFFVLKDTLHAPPAKEIKLEDHCEYRYDEKIIIVTYSIAVWRKLNK